MLFNDFVTGALGYSGVIPIGRGHFKDGKWSVELFGKSASIRAASRREVRLLLAVHGASRVEMTHEVQAIWPAGIMPPWQTYLPPNSPLLRQGLPTADNFFQTANPWLRKWVSAV